MQIFFEGHEIALFGPAGEKRPATINESFSMLINAKLQGEIDLHSLPPRHKYGKCDRDQK